jgi:hypothetical protein
MKVLGSSTSRGFGAIVNFLYALRRGFLVNTLSRLLTVLEQGVKHCACLGTPLRDYKHADVGCDTLAHLLSGIFAERRDELVPLFRRPTRERGRRQY